MDDGLEGRAAAAVFFDSEGTLRDFKSQSDLVPTVRMTPLTNAWVANRPATNTGCAVQVKGPLAPTTTQTAV